MKGEGSPSFSDLMIPNLHSRGEKERISIYGTGLKCLGFLLLRCHQERLNFLCLISEVSHEISRLWIFLFPSFKEHNSEDQALKGNKTNRSQAWALGEQTLDLFRDPIGYGP